MTKYKRDTRNGKNILCIFLLTFLILANALPAAAAMKFTDVSSDYRGAVMVKKTAVWKEHKTDSGKVTTLKYGDNVRIVKEAKKWYYVKTSEGKGYVEKEKLVKYNKKKKHIALTFDDGPSTSNTPTVLTALKKYQAKATFFVLGERINEAGGKLLKQAVKQGCDIGNHSYSHPQLTKKSESTIKSEISKTDNLVKKYTDMKPALFRAPYGSTNSTVLRIMDRPNIYWSVDTEDWKYKDSSRLINYVSSHAGDGQIVLMHDIHASTAKAVDSICKKLTEKGYEMVTVRELAAIKKQNLKKKTTYYSIK